MVAGWAAGVGEQFETYLVWNYLRHGRCAGRHTLPLRPALRRWTLRSGYVWSGHCLADRGCRCSYACASEKGRLRQSHRRSALRLIRDGGRERLDLPIDF